MLGRILSGWLAFAVVVGLAKAVTGGPWLTYLVIEAVGWAVCFGVVLYFYRVALVWYTRGAAMQRAVNDPSLVELPFAAFLLERSPGIQIDGWHVPETVGLTRQRSAVIYSHGFGNSREVCGEVTYRQMAALHQAGHAIFTFDYPYGDRAHSHQMTAGIEESRDLLAVVDYVRSLGYAWVAVFGYSFGGGTALLAAQSGKVNALFLDSAFVARLAVMTDMLKRFAGFPPLLSRILLPTFWKHYIGVAWREHPMNTILDYTYTVPMLIAHGTHDADAPYAIMASFAQKHSRWATLLSVPEGEHMELHAVLGEQRFNDAIVQWLAQVLQPVASGQGAPA